jgi:hypothetical protein
MKVEILSRAKQIENIKNMGIIYRTDFNAEMYLVHGKWSKFKKRHEQHWYMVSPYTGIHCVTTFSNRPDERVNIHWDGFVRAQYEFIDKLTNN